MPQKAFSMRQIKEVLRLRYDLGLLQSEIARSCCISQSSVNQYLEQASAAGLSRPLSEDCDDRRLNELLFPAEPTGGRPRVRAPLDCAAIHRQLQSSKYVTLQLVWEEYRQSQPEGYRDTVTAASASCTSAGGTSEIWFCAMHLAGEKIFVDWAGATIPIYGRETGEKSGRLRFLWLYWRPALTPLRAPRSARIFPTGSSATSRPSSSFKAPAS
jgi:hypothetical protein